MHDGRALHLKQRLTHSPLAHLSVVRRMRVGFNLRNRQQEGRIHPSHCSRTQPTPQRIALRIRHVNARAHDLEPRPVVPSCAITGSKSKCKPRDSDNPSVRLIPVSGSWTGDPLPTSMRFRGTHPLGLRQNGRRIHNIRVPYVLCPAPHVMDV